METLTAIGRWIADSESLLSGAAAIIVLLGVVGSVAGFVYRRVMRLRVGGNDSARDGVRGLRRHAVDDAALPRHLEVACGASEADHLADEPRLARGQCQRAADQADARDADPVEAHGHRPPRSVAVSASMNRSFSAGSPTVTRRYSGKP